MLGIKCESSASAVECWAISPALSMLSGFDLICWCFVPRYVRSSPSALKNWGKQKQYFHVSYREKLERMLLFYCCVNTVGRPLLKASLEALMKGYREFSSVSLSRSRLARPVWCLLRARFWLFLGTQLFSLDCSYWSLDSCIIGTQCSSCQHV